MLLRTNFMVAPHCGKPAPVGKCANPGLVKVMGRIAIFFFENFNVL